MALRRLQHPHIARIFDHGFADDVAYVVTEYFPRGSLRDLLWAALPPARALELLRQAASALAEHARLGIVHDAVTPERFLLRDSGDLALAAVESSIGGSAKELEHYRAPEVVQGGKRDQRSDVYALGMIFLEMLTGKHQSEHSPASSLPAALASLQPFVARLLAKEPAQRFASAQAVLDAIGAL
jgi:serine/threonine protein kinase